MKNWIMELCPEIDEWQADLIAEQAQKEVAAEREACAKLCESEDDDLTDDVFDAQQCIAAAIRNRSKSRGS